MRKALLSLSLLMSGPAAVVAGTAGYPLPDTPAVEQQVNHLLGELSLQQKVDLLGGVDGFCTRAMPTIGLPRLCMSDGPVGVRMHGPSNAYAAGMALAASWDPSLAREVGTSIGKDARARGISFVLGPAVNIYRAPLDGRNMEYYGEDPLLAGSIAVGMIKGIQSQGVVATIKHFVANNSEYDRRHLDSLVDERTLHEIYLRAFEMAVKQGHVGAVMSSYNRVNGDYTAESRYLIHDVLDRGWGFKGLFMSDWGAVHDGIKAFKAGLDLEMPAADQMTPAKILQGLQDGTLSQTQLDSKVRRLLRTAVRFGLMDRPRQDYAEPLLGPAANQVALRSALESAVLLKNAHHTLPFDAARMKTIAVIGPMAYPGAASAGGSSHIDTFHTVSILEGISQLVGSKVKVLYSPGLPTPDQVFKRPAFVTGDGKPGLLRQTFDNPDFAGLPAASTVDATVDHWKPELWTTPATLRKSIRWSGRFVPGKSGKYLFLTAAASQDSYTLYVNGKAEIVQPMREGQAPHAVTLSLVAGKPVQLRLDYKPDVAYSRMGFGVIAVDDLIAPAARKMAAMADAAVVAVGYGPAAESEAFDRSFELPWGQAALIRAVARANPHTVVTVTSGGGYATRGWLDDVPALLQNWYPGQQGGTAIADILFGRHSPEGKLPFSFQRAWKDNPVHDFYYAHAAPDGHPVVRYGEGVLLGYRWYTSHPDKPQPVFPFGFGLSYTQFRFSHLKVSGPSTDGSVEVAFDVANTGHRAGAEVAQVYVGDPSAQVARPARELKGFRKLRLAPGESRHVNIVLDRRAFAYYDVCRHGWRVDPGKFVVYVGDASDSTPLQADITMGAQP
ncbi:glycoside hydrolase family 3 C-terminal domain-containing protein [Dyella sp. A6]|uniref:glycoside hydrolase family 3 C-terminal domain-containing protein n=1 Tax=Dyella aluminiiresistens TaxID=3069105 RepID=UPI002E76093D|nr:glycoside hydrolase family 3 C-terminal domain-containing protein [Dyella sp. A6]